MPNDLSWFRPLHVARGLVLFAAGAAPLMAAPSITATKDDGVTTGAKVAPGATVTYTNTIANGGAPATTATGVKFEDPDIPNTTLVPGSLKATPVAVDDILPYTVIANTSINTAKAGGDPDFSVVDNDFAGYAEGAAVAKTSLTISATTQPANGTVVMTTSGANVGKFTYAPNPGFTGTDTFTYTIDNTVTGGTTQSRIGTVTITVGGPVVWIVNPNLGSNGNGTLQNPFNALSSAVTAMGSNANQRIFIFSGGAAQTAGVTLNTNGWLVGQSAVGTDFDLLMDIGYPVDTVTARPSLNSSLVKPVVTRASGGSTVTLGNQSKVFGVEVTNTGGGYAINANSVNEAVVGDPSISDPTSGDVIIKSSGGSSGSVSINAGSGAIQINAPITAEAGRAVNITSRTGTSAVTFPKKINNPVTESGTGINITGNSAQSTFAFTGGLDLNTKTNNAFNVAGGGKLSVTQNGTTIINTITTTTGVALSVASTTIEAAGLTFRSISSSGGGNVGISLVSTGTAGGLTVTGLDGIDGDSDPDLGSGGTISGKTGSDGATNSGIGVYLSNTRNISLNGMQFSNFDNSAIRGVSVTKFRLASSAITGFSGNSTGMTEGPIAFGTSSTENGLLGTGADASVIDKVQISGAVEHGIELYNQSGSFGLTISNSTIGSNNTATGSDGVLIETQGTSTGTININNNTFTSNKSQAIQVASIDSSVANLTISNNTITRGTQGNEGIVVSNSLNADLFASITNNVINGFGGASIFAGQTPGNATAASTLHATITGNQVTALATATNHAIMVYPTSTVGAISPARIVIDNNTVTQHSSAGMAGIFVSTPDASTTPDFHVKVNNNNVAVTDNATGGRGIVVQATRGSGHFSIGLNTVTYPNGKPAGVPAGLRVRAQVVNGSTPTVNLERLISPSTVPATVLAANNTSANGTEVTGDVTPTVVANGTVLSPTTPALPLFFAPSAEDVTSNVSSSGNVPQVSAVRSEPVIAPGASIPFETVLTQQQLDSLVAAARSRWEASGLSQVQREALGRLSFQVADLPGTYLGEAAGDTIRIDNNAGGNAWFVDATPMEDSEFAGAKMAGVADRVDLLTTLMHEMGHTIGLCDTYSTSDQGSLMFGFLSKGERRVPQQGQAKDAEPHAHTAPHFLAAPIDIGTLPPGKSVVITYDVTLNATHDTSLNTPAGATLYSQGTVKSTTSSFTDVLTDDTTIVGASNPTATLVDLPQVTVVASAASLPEDGTGTVTYTFSRTGATTVPLVVNFSTGGTAALGGDYTLAGGTGTLGTGTITIPTGSSTGTLIMSPADDTTVESNETVILGVATGTAYAAGTPASATSTINNDDTDVTLAVSPSSVTEDGLGNLLYTFTRTGVTSGTLTVNFDVSGDAVFGTDYEQSGAATFGATSGTVTFTGTNTTATITLNPTGDNAVESDETAVLTLATGANYNVASPAAATGTITNDDSTVKIEMLAATSVVEDSAGTLVYTLTRTGPTTNALTVNVNVSGTASAANDFAHNFASFNSGTGAATVTFAAGSATQTVTIDPAVDTDSELDETIILTLAANGTAATTGGYEVDSAASIATGTIIDDDTLVNVAVTPASSGEGSGTGMEYTFTRNGATTLALPVNFTVGGTATLATDYTVSGADTFLAASGTVTIPIGQASATVTLTPVEDVLVEGSETAILTVVAGTGYTPTGTAATGTITDNDTATIGYAAATSTIGEGGVSNSLDLVLTLNTTGTGTPELARAVTVGLTSTGGSATVTTDYALPTPLTFAAGSASGAQQQAVVAITNDRSVEGTEVANLGLSIGTDGTNGQVTIASAAAAHTATITDNDTATIAYSGSTSAVSEAAGTTSLTLGLVITGDGTGSQVLARDVTVNVTTVAGGTATNGGTDYGLPATVTFASGSVQGASQAPSLTIVNDVLVEGAETAALGLEIATDGTDGAVSLGAATHTVTINDNDSATVTFVAATGSVSEGAGTHSVGLVLSITSNGTGTAALAGDLGVNVITGSGGSATGGVDYTLPAAATFAAGSGNATGTSASVTINEDLIVEGSEIANLGLSLVSNFGGQVTIGATGVQALTITDNDTATLALAKTNDGAEAATSTNPLFTITQSAVSSTDTVISYSVNGTATSGSDYTTLSGSATILAGNTTVDIAVPVINDSIVEPTETVGIALGSITSGQASVTLGSSTSATADITDNDTTTLTLAPVSADKNEGTGGTTTSFTFSATLTNGVQGGFTIPFTTNDGTATVAGSDYTDNDGTLTFSGTASESQTITVLVTQDATHEQDETFSVALGSVSGLASGISAGNVTVAGSPATGTIRNDDALTVTVAATDNTADEAPGATGTWRVSRNTAVGELTVQLAIGAGSSASSADWTQTGANFASLAPSSTGTLVIPDGSTFVDVTLTATDDIHAEANETVILNVTPDAAYTVGGAGSTITIAANDFVVVNANDSGEGSLRQAVANANNIAGPQTITFEGSVFTDSTPDTITLASGVLTCSSDIVVNGLGAKMLSISGNNTSRIFDIYGGSTVVRGLHLTRGLGSAAPSRGGAILIDSGALTAIACDFDANTAPRGGAIGCNGGVFNVVSSTFRNNVATSSGGAIYATTDGVRFNQIHNSTLSGNSGNGGAAAIEVGGGVTWISNCTLTANSSISGSAIQSYGDAQTVTRLGNTVVAGNSSNGDLRLFNGSVQSIQSDGGNVIGNVGSITTMGVTDIAGTSADPIDPLLDPLADNGGPTLTHAIRAGSPALNRGLVANVPADIADADGDNNTTEPLPYDQRGVGYGRSVGTAPDAGAFELGKIISIAALDASKSEGSSGTTAFTFIVSRIGDTVGAAVVNYAVTGSGTNPVVAADFGAALPSGTFSIPEGQASATLTINVTGDTLVENTEEFTVTLTSPPPAYVIGTDTAIGTITDDDTATLSIAKVNDGEETNPTATAGVFRVSQSAAASTDTVVSYSVSGTATAPSDFAALSGSVTIPAGSTSADVNIAVVRDFVVEGTENVTLTLSTITSGDPQVTVGTPASATLDILDSAPAAIAMNSGSSQNATVNTGFAAPLVALVTDSAGNPLQGASVTFTAPGSGASAGFASSATVTTNASGLATSPALTANTVAGSYSVNAATPGVATPATFSLGNTPGAATHFAVNIPANSVAGVSVNATVTALDQFNNIATGYAGTVTLSSTDGAAILPANGTLTNGARTFAVTFRTGGNQTVTATDTVASSITGASAASAVSPRADLAVIVIDSVDPVDAGSNLTYTITVTNSGPSAAESVQLASTLPAGTTFVSLSSPGGWSATTPAVGAGGTINASIANLPIGSAVFTLTVNVTYLPHNTVLSNSATVSSTVGDPNTGNETGTATTTVSAIPEIAVFNGVTELTDGQATAVNFGSTTVNNPLTRTFTVRNVGTGPLSLTGITLPTGYSLPTTFTAQTIAPTASFSFDVRYDALTVGVAAGSVVIANNDDNELSFDFPITAERTNLPPIATAQSVATDEDEALPITLAGTDPDNDPLGYQIMVQPAHGMLSGTPPNITYIPDANYNGPDSFEFRVNDGTVNSVANAVVSITVNAVNDDPVVAMPLADVLHTAPGQTATINLANHFSDIETLATSLTYTVTPPSGSVYYTYNVVGTTLTITGTAPGIADFIVTANDGELSVSDDFEVHVKHVPEIAGSGIPDTLLPPDSTGLDINLDSYFVDGDGDAMSYAVIANTDTTMVETAVSGSTLTLHPHAPGTVTLTIRATDSDLNTVDQTFDVTVNDPVPVLNPTPSSPPAVNPQTGSFEITVTAVNNNMFDVPGFRLRVVSPLPDGIILANSTGPAGAFEPYLDVLTRTAPGQSLTVKLEFQSPRRNFTGFNPTIIAEPLPDGLTDVGTGAGVAVTLIKPLADGSMLLEFTAQAGKFYEVQYSNDGMTTWKKCLVPIQASANRVQWIDRGSPYTDSHPNTVPSRFYRFRQID